MNSNLAIFHKYLDFLNSADLNLGASIISETAFFFVPGRTQPLTGIRGALQIIAMIRAGFPNAVWSADEITETTKVLVARLTIRGTHLGKFFGSQPTNKEIEMKAINIYKINHDMIIESRAQIDFFSVLQQIGALPKFS